MKLSNKQKNDLETIMYFVPSALEKYKDQITEKDIEDFFAYSDRGIRRGDEDSLQVRDGYHTLIEGKRWRGIHAHEIYEKDLASSYPEMPYVVLLEGMPRSVVEFLKKELFGGADAATIERAYLIANG